MFVNETANRKTAIRTGSAVPTKRLKASPPERAKSGLRIGGELGEVGMKVGVGGVAQQAVGLPEHVAIGAGDEDIGIVSPGEVDEFLPIFFVIINGNEV
jgi:hypothetical protein